MGQLVTIQVGAHVLVGTAEWKSVPEVLHVNGWQRAGNAQDWYFRWEGQVCRASERDVRADGAYPVPYAPEYEVVQEGKRFYLRLSSAQWLLTPNGKERISWARAGDAERAALNDHSVRSHAPTHALPLGPAEPVAKVVSV